MSRAAAAGFLAVLLASSGLGAPRGCGAQGPALAEGRERHAGGAPRSGPVVEILGVRLGMSETEAQRRLRPLGTRRELESEEAEQAEAQGKAPVEGELWTLRGREFSYVVLGVEAGRVIAIRAICRPGRRALRYRDIGDIDRATRQGFYIYEWVVPGRSGEAGQRIQARGTDPEYLASYSIVRDRAQATGESLMRGNASVEVSSDSRH